MTGKKQEPPLYLDMDFEEALQRFIGVDPAELPNDKRISQKKAPKRKPPANRAPNLTRK